MLSRLLSVLYVVIHLQCITIMYMYSVLHVHAHSQSLACYIRYLDRLYRVHICTVRFYVGSDVLLPNNDQRS